MFPLPICDNENAGNTYYRKSLHMKCALKDSTKGGTSDTFEHIQPKIGAKLKTTFWCKSYS